MRRAEFAEALKANATSLAKLLIEKNKSYGNSFAVSGDFLKILWPEGVAPHQYTDMLTIIRIFDKIMRIINKKGAFEENPFRDIAGYALLQVALESMEVKESMKKAEEENNERKK